MSAAASATSTDVSSAVRTPSFDAPACHQRSVYPGGGQAKAALDAAMETTLAEGLRFEKHVFAALFDTHDQKEGMAAFREKRDPSFENR